MTESRSKPAKDELRLDRWLWAARFYKTRSAATRAVSGGKVQVGGHRVKPAKLVRPGDELRIRRGIYEYVVVVEGIRDRRRPAPEARELYRELEESVARREALAAARKAGRLVLAEARAAGRPNKKQRRQIAHFTRGD